MPRPMPAASRAVGAPAIRRCTAGAAPNLAAWYRCSDVGNAHGPAAMGTASGAKLLNSPQGALVKRLFRYRNNRYYSGIRFIPDCLGLFKKVQVFQYIR